jgi:Flp pilus assembly pilin Flp
MIKHDENAATDNPSTRSIRKLAKDTRGAALTEYVILVGLVAMAAFGAYEKFGKSVNTKVGQAQGKVDKITIQ